MQANGKYQKIATINVRQPAIVLMNPENAGSLLAQPTTESERDEAAYWKARASVYIMGIFHLCDQLFKILSLSSSLFSN